MVSKQRILCIKYLRCKHYALEVLLPPRHYKTLCWPLVLNKIQEYEHLGKPLIHYLTFLENQFGTEFYKHKKGEHC